MLQTRTKLGHNLYYFSHGSTDTTLQVALSAQQCVQNASA